MSWIYKTIRVIVAGGRDFDDYELLQQSLGAILSNSKYAFNSFTIVSGGAKGADFLGERYAKENDFKLETYPAKWEEHGKSAGPIRNKMMAQVSQIAVVFWDGESKGSRNMINNALEHGLELHVIRY